MGEGMEYAKAVALAAALVAGHEVTAEAKKKPPHSLEHEVKGSRRKGKQEQRRPQTAPGVDRKLLKISAETKEWKLPKGAFGKDENGQPYGWQFQNKYEYPISPEGPTDLETLPQGKNKDGKLITVNIYRDSQGHDVRVPLQLRREARKAFVALCEEFERTAGAELKEKGCYITEGFRPRDYQVHLRKTLGSWAAKPKYGEHELGTAIDLYAGNTQAMYNWLWAKEGGVPRIIKYGFVPTVRQEPWHLRYVGRKNGSEKGKAYYKKFGAKIINSHSRRLK